MEKIDNFTYEGISYKEVKQEREGCHGCDLNIGSDAACDAANDYKSCIKHKIIWVKDTSKVEHITPETNKQEGGSHYTKSSIQPVDYIHANKLNFFEGNVVKYITRHKNKNGAEDIRKAIHYLEMILKYEYSQEVNQESK